MARLFGRLYSLRLRIRRRSTHFRNIIRSRRPITLVTARNIEARATFRISSNRHPHAGSLKSATIYRTRDSQLSNSMAPTTSVAKDFPVYAKDDHYKRARVYVQTREFIRQKTPRLFVVSARGYERTGLVPSKNHLPPLLHRRYSIDVNTSDWNSRRKPKWTFTSDKDAILPSAPTVEFYSGKRDYDEGEPALSREPRLTLPDPHHNWTRSKELRRFEPMSESKTFLELDYSSITFEDYINVRDLGDNSWLTDSSLDVPLELISRLHLCKENSIEIANSMVSMILFRVGKHGDQDGNDYANYDEEKKRFANKRWVFLPVNDGMTCEDPFQAIDNGLHWSFVAIDRNRRLAHYVDSLFIEELSYRKVGFHVQRGLGRLLGEDYKFKPEWHSPHQRRHNRSRFSDPGPCGPFVIEMTYRMVSRIRDHQNKGLEQQCLLEIPRDYGHQQPFDSYHIREKISNLIGQAHLQWIAGLASEAHDRIAFEGYDGTVIDEEAIEEVETATQQANANGQERSDADAQEGISDAQVTRTIEEADDESDGKEPAEESVNHNGNEMFYEPPIRQSSPLAEIRLEDDEEVTTETNGTNGDNAAVDAVAKIPHGVDANIEKEETGC